jgi:3,4-dihydroxy-2-butanone 4-phosphate synthase
MALSNLESLTIGKLPVILFDDVDTEVGYLMGNAEDVSGESVNFMIHFGRGLVYVCITEDRAKELDLPLMGLENSFYNKNFTVSVDFKTNTTGISAQERANTISAFVQPDVNPEDFIRPGHIFPLISKSKRLIERIGIAEAAVLLSEIKSNYPVAYVCEILNENGKVANRKEALDLSKNKGLPFLNFSELVNFQYESIQWLQIVDKRSLDRSKQIFVYTVYNELFNQEFKIYVRQGRNVTNNIIYYKECEMGDLIGLLGNNQCQCKTHFKDYYKQLFNNEIDAIILSNEQMKLTSPMKQELIFKQIKQLVKEIYKTNDLNKISNF